MPGEIEVEVGGERIRISSPDRVVFPEQGWTKLDVVNHFVTVGSGAARGINGRPTMLKRYMQDVTVDPIYHKRASANTPFDTVQIRFPSQRPGRMNVPRTEADVVRLVQLGCLDFHPWPVRATDIDHPDELRFDFDPTPGVGFDQLREAVAAAASLLAELGLVGWPKTSGSRGIHVYVRIEPLWDFFQTRRAVLAFARELERRMEGLVTTKWWKEERQGVFIDYNQNAKDRTVAAAYSVRPKPDARVSAPLAWGEVGDCDPADFTMATMPARFAAIGHRHAAMDLRPCSLESLLELSARHQREGQGDAPWPPQYKKQPGEPPRVQPSRRRQTPAAPRARKPATGRRVPKRPLIEIGRSTKKEDALAGLERWKKRHAEAASHLEPADVLVDAMRGRSSTWTRIRVNLEHVPEALRPEQEPLDPDDPPTGWREWHEGTVKDGGG
jgi:DNA ligase D-like protein (predicted polymerase)